MPECDQPELQLRRRIGVALVKSPYFSRRSPLRLSTENGCVKLTGTVRSFFHKQMAQEVVKTVDGVAQIENQLEVLSTEC